VWGTTWRQRLRLAPLYAATRLADAVPRRARPLDAGAWPPGVSVVIPERDGVDLLAEALASLSIALREVREPTQVIVVVNGAPISGYAPLQARFAGVEWIHDDAPLGFAGAIERGIAQAKHGASYLLNNDMTLDARALAELLPLRERGVFAIGSQIEQRSADGRREETGFTDWYVDGGGLRLFHAPVADGDVRPHVCASGGAALFRTSLLREYLPASRAYDPFYWEDVEWSVRARRDGYEVLFCPRSHARHKHRATTARFYAPEELARIVERNRILFDLRHGASGETASTLLGRVCELAYASQRELARPVQARGVWRQRRGPRLAAPSSLAATPIARVTSSYSFRLREPSRTRILFVSPFAVFPPRHGGARRVAELVRGHKAAFDIALVSDEATLYDARSFADFDGLCDVRLVQRADRQPARDLTTRMREHCHDTLMHAMKEAMREFAPRIVVVEHAELAPVISLRSGQRFVLDLHDAYGARDFATAQEAAAFAALLTQYDALTVCSHEDRALVSHRRVEIVANGARIDAADAQPSSGNGLLFIGPFRYGPNREGIAAFLREAWPAVRAAVPEATLTVLGGDESLALAASDPALRQAGVTVLGHRDDVPSLLARCAIAINPIAGIRGSAVKLVETLAAGRVCVSTRDGARGFAGAAPALVTVERIAEMPAPIVRLLRDSAQRHALETTDRGALDAFGWHHSVARQRALFESLTA
jgi:GT2 family glycosyltransferase